MTSSSRALSNNGWIDSGFLDSLEELGVHAITIAGVADLDTVIRDDMLSLVFVDPSSMSRNDLDECVSYCLQLKLPSILLVAKDRVTEIDSSLEVDDFILMPASMGEIEARVEWVLHRTSLMEGTDQVRACGLVINRTNYEVSVNGRPINLRFKEYELLVLMAANPGRVYSREALLSQIWGYDYLGGTRTVDVHIRRLRSKIEDVENQFIETVWNVGYRFRYQDDG